MKYLYLLVAGVTLFLSTYSQQVTVLNAITLEPVADVVVYTSSQSISANTNVYGEVSIEGISPNDTLFFSSAYRKNITA
jgi:hypothetical protein